MSTEVFRERFARALTWQRYIDSGGELERRHYDWLDTYWRSAEALHSCRLYQECSEGLFGIEDWGERFDAATWGPKAPPHLAEKIAAYRRDLNLNSEFELNMPVPPTIMHQATAIQDLSATKKRRLRLTL